MEGFAENHVPTFLFIHLIISKTLGISCTLVSHALYHVYLEFCELIRHVDGAGVVVNQEVAWSGRGSHNSDLLSLL